jgi:hypothetical protein
MKKHNLLIVPQPVQAKAATSTRTNALETCMSERAQEPTRAWAGCGR